MYVKYVCVFIFGICKYLYKIQVFICVCEEIKRGSGRLPNDLHAVQSQQEKNKKLSKTENRVVEAQGQKEDEMSKGDQPYGNGQKPIFLVVGILQHTQKYNIVYVKHTMLQTNVTSIKINLRKSFKKKSELKRTGSKRLVRQETSILLCTLLIA